MFSRDFSHGACASAAVKSGTAAAGFVQVVQIVGFLRFMGGIATAFRDDDDAAKEISQNLSDGAVGNVVADASLHRFEKPVLQ